MFRLRKYFFYFFWHYPLSRLLGRRWITVIVNPKLYNFLILARLCYIRRIGNSALVQARHDGFFFVQPIDNIFINDEIFFDKAYELHRQVLKRDVVFDLGAHVGIFSIKAAAVASKVISVEPNPFNFKLLNFNARSNHLENLITVNSAVADYDGDAKMYLHSRSGWGSILSTRAHSSVSSVNVKVRKLDTIVEELDIKRVDFLKIDVEGAEFYVLKGAINTIKKHRPFIVMEYHPRLSCGAKSKIISFLENRNYCCREEGCYIHAYYVERLNNEQCLKKRALFFCFSFLLKM
jgi:FkbM family methyltransferase